MPAITRSYTLFWGGLRPAAGYSRQTGIGTSIAAHYTPPADTMLKRALFVTFNFSSVAKAVHTRGAVVISQPFSEGRPRRRSTKPLIPDYRTRTFVAKCDAVMPRRISITDCPSLGSATEENVNPTRTLRLYQMAHFSITTFGGK
ncbi:hypothetical protein EI94DRAFT_1697283 [Lactarius quietus]|nr:hypothetical protein EI94DRAFT_1697283 [Lactarius quietus]